MSQGDQSIANQAGAAFRSDLNAELQALVTLSSGTSAPGTTYARQYWADTTANLLKRRNAANSAWLVVCSLDEVFVVSRSSNTILAGSDVGKTFLATSTFTQTLTAAATLGDGWYCYYRNDGSGVITLDPNSTETIDGATTLVLHPGDSCRIACNGSVFKTQGLAAMSPISNALGADVALNSTSTFFTGPSVAQGSVGIWFASGSVLLQDTGGVQAIYEVKLWDGTTVIASCLAQGVSVGGYAAVHLSGFINTPAGNIRISAKDVTSTNGQIRFNNSNAGKDSVVTAIRIRI